ncbi:hypothetical protein QE152_g9617 [Popillia japonica]|uniref:Uncharacterized protein n=1 Tax=Popillia japonica TaxID=7064 RepID=A0AAW1LU92_POPJA
MRSKEEDKHEYAQGFGYTENNIYASNKVWSFSEIENLNEGEVDTLFAEIPSDGESVDEFGESDDEKNAATNMEHKKRS